MNTSNKLEKTDRYTPVFGSAEGSLVDIDSHPDKHRHNERPEVGSDATEGESKVHALGEEGVHSASHPATQVQFQNLQKLIHLFHQQQHTVTQPSFPNNDRK